MLNLVLTYHWFDEIESGRKTIEYREMSHKWTRDIWRKRETITQVRFQRGYTKTSMVKDVVLIDIGPCPYPGWDHNYYRLHFST